MVGVYGDNDPVLWTSYATTLSTLEKAGYPPADSYLLITVDDSADPVAVQDAVEKQTAELPTVTVKDQAGFADEQRAPIDQMLLLIYALLGLALVIAVLGIVNTLALSVIERTREVGLLRAIGLARSQLRRMIRLEASSSPCSGAVLGVGMGLVFGLALMTSLADDGLEVVKVPSDSSRCTSSRPVSWASWRRCSRPAGRRGSTCCGRSRPSSTSAPSLPRSRPTGRTSG